MTIPERFKEISQFKKKLLTAVCKKIIIRKSGFSSKMEQNLKYQPFF